MGVGVRRIYVMETYWQNWLTKWRTNLVWEIFVSGGFIGVWLMAIWFLLTLNSIEKNLEKIQKHLEKKEKEAPKPLLPIEENIPPSV